jgi:signal transduction histidine kinase
MEWRAGDVTGLLPYSRARVPPGDTKAEEFTEVFGLHRDHFPELIRECHEVTAILVHVMVDRARAFTSSDSHDEKMLSLGRLSAGLAHELNNPASAVVRTAKGLSQALADVEAASQALGAIGLSSSERTLVERLRKTCLAGSGTAVLSPLERADREEEITAWLEDRGADVAAAEALAESAATLTLLDELAAALDGERLDVALRWLAAGCTTRALVSQIESAATRIHRIVQAVKGFTYMDKTVPVNVDIGRNLSDTLTVLESKAKGKSASVTLSVEPGLPTVQGFGGDLNQVWLNLVDNALDAIPTGGRVEIAASHEDGSVVVRVVDNGPGIPDDIRERIFDPFFTTKPVGQGTGLGLDITQRLLRRHDGVIDVESRPGRTEFRVTLPLAVPGPPPQQESQQQQ